MKKISLILQICILNICSIYAQPTIPNSDFEQWTDSITPGNGWGTSNISLGFYTFSPVTQTTDKHSGSYAIKLKTTNTGVAGVLPGIAVTGTYDLLSGASGGVPMTVKPESISGFIKYKLAKSTPMFFAYFLSSVPSTSKNAHFPPVFCSSEIICKLRVVLLACSNPTI